MIHNTFFTVNQTDHICLDSCSAQNLQNLWVIYCILDYLIKDNMQEKSDICHKWNWLSEASKIAWQMWDYVP